MTKPDKTKIAVIGAGMTGMVCAQALRAAGYMPSVIDKGRGIGGRIATRRVEGGLQFDHGAQFMTVRSPELGNHLATMETTGSAAQWRPRICADGEVANDHWYVGTPAMNGLVKAFASDIDLNLRAEVSSISRRSSQWLVSFSDGQPDVLYDAVICTVPAPQTRSLLTSEPKLIDSIANVEMAPCWTLMFAFDAPQDFGFDVWQEPSENISLIARSSSRPERTQAPDCWIAHASPEWSQMNLELSNSQIASLMLDDLKQTMGPGASALIYHATHRWRFARTTQALGKPFIALDDHSLYVGGDWCLGPRIECAYESGLAIAKSFLKSR